MFCFVYKWMISGAMDTGRKMPGPVHRHIGRCESCHTFAQMGLELNARLSQDAAELINLSDTALNHRILAALETKPTPSYKFSRRNVRFSPLPIFTTTFALIAVLIGLAVLTPGPAPIDTENSSILNRIFTANGRTIKESKPVLPEFMAKIESPLLQEITSLKNAVVSAKDFFVTYVGEGFGTSTAQSKPK